VFQHYALQTLFRPINILPFLVQPVFKLNQSQKV
jgi:hypothetical protein